VNSINDGVTGSAKKGTDGRDEILVPLTSSLYVKGRLTDREKVLVDVGTGFYVEKVRDWRRLRDALRVFGHLLIYFRVCLDC
jgi:prefoldin alpha subunit